MNKKRCRDVSSFHSLILLWLWLVTTYPAIADDNGTLTDKSISGLPAFQGGSPITLCRSVDKGLLPCVPFIKPKPIWKRFLILVWQYKTDIRKDLGLYKHVGLFGFHIDRGFSKQAIVDFARKHRLPYYVDHAADKGYLHLTNRTGRKRILRKKTIVPRPYSLADPKTIALLKRHIQRNVLVTRRGPVVAYAFDDEISLGVFNSPCEVDGSPLSVADYRVWLQKTYGNIDALNRMWGTDFKDFSQIQPVSFEAIRRNHTRPLFSRWNLSPWMDWRSYMDTQFANCLAKLTHFTNKLDPHTPAGIVGAQQPAPYGGYDYSKLCRSIQWIEAYDIGGTCEILRSLWCWPERRPYVQTWFSTGDARRDAWFLWYYLLHGNRGVIAWPDRHGSWFHWKNGGIAPFIVQNAATIREVQSALSENILAPETRFDADPIAVYYSHPSIQAGWVMDVVTHKGTWPNRSSSLDNTCQTAAKNRVAWFKLLEDCGFQYNVITAQQVAAGELVKQGYRVLILNRAIAMSDTEASAITTFVRKGGTVIADYLTGVLNEHGVGRPAGGALDRLFGIQRDESKGYLDGKHITEIDGELYTKPFLQRLRYDGALKYDGIVVYERGTRANGGKATTRVGTADVFIENRTGKGRTVYLNLTPVAYYDMNLRIGIYGRRWRRLISNLLAQSGLKPRAKVFSNGKPVPLAELIYWRKGKHIIVGLVKNPTRQGSISAAGAIYGVTGKPIDVEIVFRQPVRNIRDLRTGRKLPDGRIIQTRWKPWEALLFQLTPSQNSDDTQNRNTD
ncbi:MAG: beta-galactosidase trimerization domain-containing protein [Planctomycetes bacterium]|nr:beta-galactosidase trimerization domain-containing protein [Planctomycetota bacterium]